MYKIVKKSDLELMKERSTSPPIFKKYIEDYYNEMLSRTQRESLEGIGSIFLLDCDKAVSLSKLDEFLLLYPPQHVAALVLFEKDGATLEILQVLLNVNGFAVNIFAQEKHLKATIEKHYFPNHKGA